MQTYTKLTNTQVAGTPWQQLSTANTRSGLNALFKKHGTSKPISSLENALTTREDMHSQLIDVGIPRDSRIMSKAMKPYDKEVKAAEGTLLKFAKKTYGAANKSEVKSLVEEVSPVIANFHVW